MVAVGLVAGGGAFAVHCDDSDCGDVAWYGPGPTCTTDEQCVEVMGDGWYCDPTVLSYDDGCGHTIDWGRICRAYAADADADADANADADVEEDVDATADIDAAPDDATVDDAAVDEPTDVDAATDDYYPPPPYGPIPVDAGDDDAATDDYYPPPPYGPIPVDAGDDGTEIPAGWYGPPPTPR
jgi:hypothetical protein